MNAPAAAPSRPGLHWSLWTVIVTVALAAGCAAGAALWLWRTDSGLATLARALPALTANGINIDGPSGSLAHGFAFDVLRVHAGNTTVEVRRLQARLANADFGLRLSALRFDFEELTADKVLVRVQPSKRPPSAPPSSIGSPVRVTAGRLAIGELVIATGPDPSPAQLVLRNLNAGAAIGPDGYTLEQGRLALGQATAPLQLTVAGTLGGAAPFAMDLRGTLAGALQDKPLQAQWHAGGSLEELLLDADVDAGGTQGSARARIAAFDAPTLRELNIDLRDLDPAAWVAGAPSARLAVKADLKPQPGPVFTLRGPVSASNGAPGAVDRKLIPVRSAKAEVEITRERLLARDIVAELTRGSVRGSYDLSLTDVRRWQAQAQVAGVDPSAIHSKLRSMIIDGQGELQHQNETTRVVAGLANRGKVPVQLKVDLAAGPKLVQIASAELKLGAGLASVQGEVALAGAQRTSVRGTLVEFDPSLLVQGADARVSGSFTLDGALQPAPTGRLDFTLTDSQAFGRPLAGAGKVALAADQSLEVDVHLAVRSASLTARGGLGGPGQSLQLQLTVPELKDLGLALAGRIDANAQLAGDWHAPAVDVQVTGQKLRYGDNLVEELRAIASYAGGSDGELGLQLDASSHRFRSNPVLSLKTATLQASGRPSNHRLELSGNNDDAQALGAVVVGGWERATNRWSGELRSLYAGAPLNLQLHGTAPISTDFTAWKVGPAAFSLFGAQVEAAQLDTRGGVLVTSGRFGGLGLADLDPTNVRLTKSGQDSPRQRLTLRGEWQLRVGAAVDGRLLVERSGGDVYTGGPDSAMGISELRLLAEVRTNQLQASVQFEGSRAGVLDARMQADLDATEGVRLAQQRPWLITAQADLPSIAWVNALLPETLRANLRLGGSLNGKLQIDGTPADPNANGSVTGKDLRVAWIEHAIRLENGTLAARVDGSDILLDELRFEGAPAVAPADKRVRQAGGSDAGSLAVSGKLQLKNFSGVLQVQAQRMPVMQRADRWARIDGGANIVFDDKRVQLNGAVAVAAGFIDFSRPNLPTLSNDVLVNRTVEQARTPRDAPMGFTFDLGIDLGPAFYIHGQGLDTRIDGALRLRSEGRGIRATGVVEARDGVFEGFGQRLVIERGRVNFQGPVNNPGLDILALRKDLPVQVGVAITRTAQNPLIRLYSDEPMPDFQILSWLVLGRQADDTGADRASLATAAAGLLSGTGEGIPAQLAKRLGIDQVGLRTGELSSQTSLLPRASVAGNVRGTSTGSSNSSTAGEFVTIGKRLNDALTISVEQGIGSSAASLVQVSYKLSQRVSVIGRAGTENSLDFVYSLAFD